MENEMFQKLLKEVCELRCQLLVGAETLGRERSEWIAYKNSVRAPINRVPDTVMDLVAMFREAFKD